MISLLIKKKIKKIIIESYILWKKLKNKIRLFILS